MCRLKQGLSFGTQNMCLILPSVPEVVQPLSILLYLHQTLTNFQILNFQL